MTVPGLHIDPTVATPVYRQIAEGIRAAVETGAATGHTGRGTFLTGPKPSLPRPGGDPWFGAFARAVEGPAVGSLLTIYRVATSHEGISLAGGYPAGDLMPVQQF